MNVVYDICQTRRRIEIINRKIDQFLHPMLDLTHDPSIGAFLENPPSPAVPLSRRNIVDFTFKVLKGLNIPLDKSPDDKDIVDESDRVLFRNIKALREADVDSVSLADQLRTRRISLQTQLHDKGVLIGAIGTGMDLKATSIHPIAPGVVIHGTIVNAILTNRLWRDAPVWVTVLITLGAGLLTTAVVARLTPLFALISALAMGVSYLLLNGLLIFDYGHVIIGLAGPLICIAAVWSVCTLVKLVTERSERTRIEKRFRNYVDPSLVNWVIEHPEQAKFDGETREMSMAFSDLAGFTSLTERMGEKAIPLLSEYMGVMIPTIRENKGFIACLMGDGIYFFFGATSQPGPCPSFRSDRLHHVQQAG